MTIRARGFNLVEMSVVVVLVGMVASAAIIPMLSQFETEMYSREERRLELLKAAVIGYAVSHQTADGGVTVEIQVPGDPDNRRQYEYPVAGRPYLPCPDVTGDGYEDRNGFDRTGLSYLAGSATAVISISGADSRMVESGGCISTRGVLPWRTLGVPPADVWGNLYTYQVDGIWSDADIGFNQNSYIDIYDSRTVVTGTVGLFSASRMSSRRTVYGLPSHDDNVDPVELFTVSFSTIPEPMPPLVICVSLPCTPTLRMELHPEGGKQSNGDLSILYRRFATNDITEGVPFAIVSHGRNGLGAVRYNHQVNNANSDTTMVNFARRNGLVCNRPVNQSSAMSVTIVDTDRPEAYNFPVVNNANIASGACARVSYNSNLVGADVMYIRPRSSGITEDASHFDDTIVWATQQELQYILSKKGVLPAPDSPAFRKY